MIKLLHVSGRYPNPPFGGMEAVVYGLAVGLDSSRFDCRVVSATPDDRRETVGAAEFIGLRSMIAGNWVRFPSLGSARNLRAMIRWADVVHIHNPTETFNLLATHYAIRERRPLLLSVLSPGALAHHPRVLSAMLGSTDDLVLRSYFRRATLVHVSNDSDLGYVTRYTPRATMVPYGIDPRCLLQPPDPNAFRTRWNLGDRGPVLIYLGRLHPLKGPGDLIEATVRLRATHPRILTLIIGPSERSQLEDLQAKVRTLHAEGCIRILGVLEEGEKIRAIDAADVVVVPSKSDFVEGFSLVTSEAWARRKPVAGYPVGALKARVKDGFNGCLASGLSPDDLGAAIERTLQLSSITVPADVISSAEFQRTFVGLYEELSKQLADASGTPDSDAATTG